MATCKANLAAPAVISSVCFMWKGKTWWKNTKRFGSLETNEESLESQLLVTVVSEGQDQAAPEIYSCCIKPCVKYLKDECKLRTVKLVN